jgi:hypothetical protein
LKSEEKARRSGHEESEKMNNVSVSGGFPIPTSIVIAVIVVGLVVYFLYRRK